MANNQYIHGHHPSVLRSHTWRTVENSCPHLLPHLKSPALHILDIGCGPGTITADLAARVPEGLVIGIDTSADVIAKAQKHANQRGITNVQFMVGDVYNLSALGLEESSFDIVHAHQVLQHIPDPLGAMKEMRRFAKQGGFVAGREVDFSAAQWYPDIPVMHKWVDLYQRVAKGMGGDPNIGKRLHAIAMEAGFSRNDIDADVGTWCFSTPEERQFWCGLWADRTVQSDFKRNAIEGGHATEEGLKEISQGWRELEGKEDGWFVALHGQVICWKR